MDLVEPSASRSFAPARAFPGSPSSAYVDHWEATEDALFTVAVVGDDQFIFEGINPACERTGGLTNADVTGRRPEQVLPPVTAAMVTARYGQCVREGRTISYLETLDFQTGVKDWRTSLEPVRDETGRIVRILGRARQIERLDLVREALTEIEFQKALDIFPIGIALLDEQGVILFVNTAWQRFGEHYGGAPSAIGSGYVEVCGRSTSAGLPSGTEVASKLRRLLADDGEHFGHRYRWADRHFVLRATRFMLNGKLRVAMAHQDVTDLVSAQQMAARSTEQLLQVQEEERARIAMELHDSTSQHLVALGLGLASLRRSSAPSHILDDMRHSLAEAHREIRTLTYVLYPPKLSSQGLEATLRAFVDGYRRRTGLSVVTTTFGLLDGLPFEVQRAVFRVVQESLANVHHHAGARRAAIEVTLKKRGLRVTVADDGQNGATNTKPRAIGVGIRGMQARFAQFGGDLTVTHRPFGTVVDGFLPASGLQVG